MQKLKGRLSQRKQKLFDLYELLHCAMTHDDADELLNRHKGFDSRILPRRTQTLISWASSKPWLRLPDEIGTAPGTRQCQQSKANKPQVGSNYGYYRYP